MKKISTSNLFTETVALPLDDGIRPGIRRAKEPISYLLYEVPAETRAVRVKRFDIKIQLSLLSMSGAGAVRPIPRVSVVAHLQKRARIFPTTINRINSRSIIARKTFHCPDIRIPLREEQSGQEQEYREVFTTDLKREIIREMEEPFTPKRAKTETRARLIGARYSTFSEIYDMSHKLKSRRSRLARWDQTRKRKVGGRRWNRNRRGAKRQRRGRGRGQGRRRFGSGRGTRFGSGANTAGTTTETLGSTGSAFGMPMGMSSSLGAPITGTAAFFGATTTGAGATQRRRTWRRFPRSTLRRRNRRRRGKGGTYVILRAGDRVQIFVQYDNVADPEAQRASRGELEMRFSVGVNLFMSTMMSHDEIDRVMDIFEDAEEEEEEMIGNDEEALTLVEGV